jgi:predicted SprT family Zn-dependent metalloprotease
MDFGQEFSIDRTSLFIPNNISNNAALAQRMTEILKSSHIYPHARIAHEHGVRFFLTTQNSGRAYWHHSSKNRRVVTIPEYPFLRESHKPRYGEYYICHELAHIHSWVTYGRNADAHGPKFMRAFTKICPPEIQHYELEYKPRNASSAGIVPDLGMIDPFA